MQALEAARTTKGEATWMRMVDVVDDGGDDDDDEDDGDHEDENG